jgi:hypothetical protein
VRRENPGQHDDNRDESQYPKNQSHGYKQGFSTGGYISEIHQGYGKAIDHMIENHQYEPDFEEMKQGRLNRRQSLIEHLFSLIGGSEHPEMREQVEKQQKAGNAMQKPRERSGIGIELQLFFRSFEYIFNSHAGPPL